MARKKSEPVPTKVVVEEDDDSALDPDGPGASIDGYGGITEEAETKSAYSSSVVVEEDDTTESIVVSNQNPVRKLDMPSESECLFWMNSNMLEAFMENDVVSIYTSGGVMIGAGKSIPDACFSAGLRSSSSNQDDEI